MSTYALLLRLDGYDAIDWPSDPDERLPVLSRHLGGTPHLSAVDITPRLCIWSDGDRQHHGAAPRNGAADLVSVLRAEPPLTACYGTAIVTGGADAKGRIEGLTGRQFLALLRLIGAYTPEIPEQRTN
ncbi:hypothetical protein [Streptomyces sp. CLI2509]|uniref:hypothetical protein n=2 Tax=unclassified Streptomyces TaxID=2593676 RepID=UPI000BAC8EF5|nr:hypothetical protein [Streptomyces sp. CLI2509]ASY36973.1 hypothetical protein CAC01_30495 [Streptomyces sp. CLI2509]